MSVTGEKELVAAVKEEVTEGKVEIVKEVVIKITVVEVAVAVNAFKEELAVAAITVKTTAVKEEVAKGKGEIVEEVENKINFAKATDDAASLANR